MELHKPRVLWMPRAEQRVVTPADARRSVSEGYTFLFLQLHPVVLVNPHGRDGVTADSCAITQTRHRLRSVPKHSACVRYTHLAVSGSTGVLHWSSSADASPGYRFRDLEAAQKHAGSSF